MNRRPVAWLVTGAGAVLVVCALLAHNQLAHVLASRSQETAISPCRSAMPAQAAEEITHAQTVGSVTIAFTAAPDQFLAYTFTITVRDASCASLQGATVDIVLTMPSMQRMAPVRIVLSPIGAAPGSYCAQGVLMAGQWQALVQVLAPGAAQPLKAIFVFSAR